MASGSPFQLIDALGRHNVPFVIIGGHAVTFHGYLRATEDTDIVYLRSAETDELLLQALKRVRNPSPTRKRGTNLDFDASLAYASG